MTRHKKLHRATRKGKLTTPESVQAGVIADRAEGKYRNQIAKERGIDRETVTRILSQPEVAQHIQQSRSELFRALPKMRARYVKIALKGKVQYAAPVIGKVLEGLQVLIPKAERDHTLHLQDPLALRANDELDYYAKFGLWPNQDEREFYKLHKYWPQEEKLFA